MCDTFLKGQTALVTGAAKRLGRALALALADAGADVIVHYRSSRAEAESLAAEIARRGRRAWPLAADLADPQAAGALFAAAAKVAGPVHLLVNNASIFPRGRILDFSHADLLGNLHVHAWSPLVLARDLAAQGLADGCVINLLDARVVDYDREHAAYHLSKRMLFTLTRMLALELAPAIRVNAVAPGLVLPPTGEDSSYLERLRHTNPLTRHGEAEDVAEAALFLARSRFVTGQVLFVDGGRHLKGGLYD